MVDLLENETGRLHVRSLQDGGFELRGEGRRPGIRVPHSPRVTTYPLELIRLIFEAYGAVHTCDEISRDTDTTETPLDIRYSVAAYFQDDVFSTVERILDFGCGAGSSTMTLARLFPNAQIVGVDFMENFLRIARYRASHYGLENVRFHNVQTSGRIDDADGAFDLVFLNGVYEHLLPDERPEVIENIWDVLKPGGALILNQTPYRWFPIETHTSGLPLINYLPRPIAVWAIRKFSKRDVTHWSWQELLRAGVRGTSVSEIMRMVGRVDRGARRLQPVRYGNCWAGIWYAAKQARLGKIDASLMRGAIKAVESLVRLTRLPIAPYLNLAIVKSGAHGDIRTGARG